MSKTPTSPSPPDIAALLNAAVARHQAGDLKAAAAQYAVILAHAPDQPQVQYLYGLALFHTHDHAEALAAFRRVLNLTPGHAEARYMLATTLRTLGHLDEAATAYADLIARQPQHAFGLDEYGGVLFNLDRIDEAEAVIRRAIAAAPDRANPYTNLGRLFQTDHARAQEALVLHDQAIARAREYADAHNNRGVALFTLSRFEEAIDAFRRAIALKPSLSEAFNNLGNALLKTGDVAAAVANYRKAIALNPAYAEAHWNLAQTLLAQGEFAEGWREFAWRWQWKDFGFPPRGFAQPEWKGEAIEDGALLVWGEQGIGDEVLYGGMVGDLVDRGISIVWESDARLMPLIARSYPGVKTVGRTTPPSPATRDPAIRAQIATADLGAYLRADASAFPRRRAYFKADEALAQQYRDRLLTDGKTRLIGISWISKNTEFGVHKTTPLAAWAPVWTAAGVSTRFVDLQYGDTEAERKSTNLDLTHLEDLDLFNDIDGLAALIKACDLVITVSNTTAHLAGALGVPVWVMVPGGNGKLWYWDSATSRWYPSARIYRQTDTTTWEDVFAQIAKDIGRDP